MFGIIGSILILGAIPYFAFVALMIAGLLKAMPNEISGELPSVAVVIAARNEAECIGDLLDDLSQQSYDGELKFIIADDRSTDDTWAILNKYGKTDTRFKPVRISQEPTELTGKKNALTQCIKLTTAEILIETDADCRVGPDWVASMTAQFDAQTGIVVGFSSVRERSLFAIYQAIDFMGIMMSNAGMMSYEKAWSGSGQNLAFRRSEFTAIGGFSRGQNQTIGDDFYLVQNIGKRPGVRARFSWDSNSFVTTAPSETIASFYHQRVRWASDSRGLERKDPLFFLFLSSAFLLNIALLLQLFSLNLTLIFHAVWFLKFWLELLVIGIGLKRLNRLKDVSVFIIWFLLQPLYIPIMGLSGLIGKVKWK